MHNKRIKKYTHSGELRDDKDIPRLRAELERLMIQEMREEGYLPVFDMGTLWSTAYLGDRYSFKLTIFAVYAGPRKAKDFDIWENGKLVRIQ